MIKSVPVLVLGLAALIGAAGAIRARGREVETVSAPPRKPAAAPAARRPAAPAATAPSGAGTAADGLMAALQERRKLRERMTTVPPRDEERRRLGALDAEAPARAEALAAIVRGNPEAWRDVITLLSSGGDFQSARELVAGLRPAIDAPAEAVWTDVLLTSRRPEDRRLSLVALSDRGTPSVVAAMTIAAQEDPDSVVRGDALTALVLARRYCGSAESALLIRKTLQLRMMDDQDAAVRERAAALDRELAQEFPVSRPPAAVPLRLRLDVRPAGK